MATQLAARGLDFPSLRHVVMFDLSEDIGSFVHCVGRTARQGRRGQVTCLVQVRGTAAGLPSFCPAGALVPHAAPKSSPLPPVSVA